MTIITCGWWNDNGGIHAVAQSGKKMAVYLTEHCHRRIVERVGVSADNRHQCLIRDMERYGERVQTPRGQAIIFGNAFVPVDGTTAITFILRNG